MKINAIDGAHYLEKIIQLPFTSRRSNAPAWMASSPG